MGNPNPSLDGLIHLPRGDDSTEPLAASPMAIRLPRSIDEAVRKIPQHTVWVRMAVIAQLKKEGRI